MPESIANRVCPEADRLVGPLSRHTHSWLFGRYSAVRRALLGQGVAERMIPPAPERVEDDPTVRAMGRAAAEAAVRTTRRRRGGGVPVGMGAE